ncbi:Serine/threonine-protein kinase [Ophidiomyces ophidiicola]|nr:Serine/threonine-protein kinase [Ophidiomyces ophidiicola]KAI2012381.1 Serine/threonine-protein kinase [Ophidiomyces ophidiicola]KAI2048009.1 Serine/threonine-protein kinase [Ophidiomyces ophidiicola]KAI2132917.1 Serine/threonine-protein kinase [Ophidiomyces ophidiicola]KAI2211589.1 Serine/threonine-protein kinase [Ophidiomyces ophidiicola]
MSTTAPQTSPVVVRNHAASHSHSYRPPLANHQRARSSGGAHSQHSPSHSRSGSRSYAYNRPPPNRSFPPRNGDSSRPPDTGNTRRSSSRDRSQDPNLPYRTDSRSYRPSSSRPSYSQNSSSMPGTATVADGYAPGHAPHHIPPNGSGITNQTRRRTTIAASSGQWALGKTIGAGSMGKVKLAKNTETGEQAAVKIIPRHSTEEHRSTRESERADRSKEIRTAREAAIVMLLNHPFICGMRDVVRTNHHWYMLFEYVNGGQMLDYIISHGKLKEKQARKFARQIASALEYCHKNNIVHRDLKIENILISKTGDIKIIDFGLSNLFSPKGQLKTFCGSLYFAAPELLQARQYTGPEVDVWSFGIVLYVLVCGKVPFDDQSMPQLHAKIKKGIVEYPQGLSSDCRHIISRMLVTDPKQRASLSEIMNHPWMTKGFNGPPENHLPHREPLQLPLDSEVIHKMTGFDFGPPEFISVQLTKILESDEYQNAVRACIKEQHSPNPMGDKKRGVFDFYKRRNSASKDTLSNASLETMHQTPDSINGYHPLLSIYNLVKEKLNREKHELHPGGLAIPHSPGDVPVSFPDIPVPKAAHTNQNSYEIPGDKDAGGRSRPRARTHGDDDLTEATKNLRLARPSDAIPPAIITPQIEQAPKKENPAVGLLRRLSTRRTRDRGREERGNVQQVPILNTPDSLPSPRKSFSVRRSRRGEAAPGTLHPGGSQPQQEVSRNELSSKTNNSLGRSTSVNSADFRGRRDIRRGVLDSLSPTSAQDPPLTSGSDRSSLNIPRAKVPEASDARTLYKPQTLRTKSLGHARRESIQARRARREEAREANVPEETDAELAEVGTSVENGNGGEDFTKPVYLKGLFSVSTTSNKPLQFIRSDIIRVLKQLGVEYVEIRGGFSCRHAPSIDLNRIVYARPSSPEHQDTVAANHRRRISFGGLRVHDREDKDKDDGKHHARSSRRHPDQSFVSNSDGSDDYAANQEHNAGERVLGETTTRVQSDTGENLVLRFEILIVKVPLFSLHGIQFKKVSGGMWQYREMAKKILDALRL